MRYRNVIPPEPQPQALVAKWLLDDRSGYARDQSPNRLDGTWSLSPGYLYGRFGQQAVMDGTTTQYVNLGLKSQLNLSRDFTITAWVYHTASGYGCIMSGTIGSYSLRIENTGTLLLLQSYTTNMVTGNAVLATNRWYFVAATVSSGSTATCNLYVDAKFDATNTTTVTLSSSRFFLLGADGGASNFSEGFAGAIRNVRFYKKELAQTELAAIYAIESGMYVPSRKILMPAVAIGSSPQPWLYANNQNRMVL